MSEREVRQKADHPWSCLSHKVGDHEYRHGVIHEIHYPCDCGLKEALSEPPDVVLLLRWLRKEHGANLLKEQGRESTSSKVLWAIITELQKTVRLTADGWKWVEERE